MQGNILYEANCVYDLYIRRKNDVFPREGKKASTPLASKLLIYGDYV